MHSAQQVIAVIDTRQPFSISPRVGDTLIKSFEKPDEDSTLAINP